MFDEYIREMRERMNNTSTGAGLALQLIKDGGWTSVQSLNVAVEIVRHLWLSEVTAEISKDGDFYRVTVNKEATV